MASRRRQPPFGPARALTALSILHDPFVNQSNHQRGRPKADHEITENLTLPATWTVLVGKFSSMASEGQGATQEQSQNQGECNRPQHQGRRRQLRCRKGGPAPFAFPDRGIIVPADKVGVRSFKLRSATRTKRSARRDRRIWQLAATVWTLDHENRSQQASEAPTLDNPNADAATSATQRRSVQRPGAAVAGRQLSTVSSGPLHSGDYR